jgi:lysozyme family protein
MAISPENLALIDRVIVREGGDHFTDDPADRGGATKFGITQNALAEWLRRPVHREEVRDLTLERAREFYAWLLEDSGVGRILNPLLREVVFDGVVNHGRAPGVRLLQRALGVRDDGVIGPVTLAAVPHLDARRLAARALTERLRLYGRLISGNLTDADRDGIPDNTEFAAGWINRAAGLMDWLNQAA